MRKAIYSQDHRTIIARLKRARLEAGLSQEEAANKLNRTQSYVSKIESGQRRVDVIQLREFSKIYKKELNFFVK